MEKEIKMDKEITLKLKTPLPKSTCELWIMRNDLSQFVKRNWDLLWQGARIAENDHLVTFKDSAGIPFQTYERDTYAGERIQSKHGTRLCEFKGLKYANGHKYSEVFPPSEHQLWRAIKDIQFLIDRAAATSKSSFKLEIVKK